MSMFYKPKCENNDTNTIRTSSDSHLHWKKYFHKIPLYFRIYANFETDNELDKSSVENKTTVIYKKKTNT